MVKGEWFGGGTTAGQKDRRLTTMKASFAFGPFTAAMSINDYGVGGSVNGTSNDEQSSYKVFLLK